MRELWDDLVLVVFIIATPGRTRCSCWSAFNAGGEGGSDSGLRTDSPYDVRAGSNEADSVKEYGEAADLCDESCAFLRDRCDDQQIVEFIL
jgi:hypothetical protein